MKVVVLRPSAVCAVSQRDLVPLQPNKASANQDSCHNGK